MSAINLAMDEILNKKARKKSQRSRQKSFSVIAESWTALSDKGRVHGVCCAESQKKEFSKCEPMH